VVETSRWQGAFALHTATCLTRLWRERGAIAKARDMLVPIYNDFTEGFDTPDLQDAKAPFDELS